MTISLFGAVVALLLLIVPFYAFYALDIRLSKCLVTSIIRMLVALGVAAAMVKLAVVVDNIAVTLLICLLLIVAAALVAVARSRQRMGACLLPTLAGIGASVIIVVCFLCLMVVSSPQITSPQMLISIVAIVAGGCIVPVSEALAAYYSGLKHHASLYNYLIGNGSDKEHALNYLLRRAIQRASTPSLRYIGGMIVASQPYMMWTLVAVGVPLSSAIAWQAVMVVGIMSAAIGATMLALIIARKYNIDEYSRINI